MRDNFKPITERSKAWAAFKERMTRGEPIVLPPTQPCKPKGYKP